MALLYLDPIFFCTIGPKECGARSSFCGKTPGSISLAVLSPNVPDHVRDDVRWDVRDVEYPARFAHDIRSAVRGRDIRAAMRLPSFVYVQGGERHVAMFRDPPLECDRFEAQTLHCTFEIEVPRDGGGTIRVTDGELEIALKSNAMADAILEGTVGMAADEAVDRAQETLDRANMR